MAFCDIMQSSMCSREGAVDQSIHDSAAMDLPQENRPASRESREQRDAGRLRINALKALLAEGAAVEAGANVQRIDALASKYGVDFETLKKVMRYTRLLELASDNVPQ
jgi:hypothetical protein